MGCYLLFADGEWDRQILNDTSTFYRGPLQSVKETKKTIYLGKLHLQAISPLGHGPSLTDFIIELWRQQNPLCWCLTISQPKILNYDLKMVIYVASPHPQESRVLCQETNAFFSADLYSGKKIGLMTQDILYFLDSDFQSGSDDRSHLRGKGKQTNKTKTPQHTLRLMMAIFCSFLKDSSSTYKSHQY